MDATSVLNELIDFRTFSNLWFWLSLAAIWFSASHWVMGIPYDMALRGREEGTQDETDFRDSVRISVNRLTRGTEAGRVWTVAIASFVLTALALLGFLYGIEFAQAVFLLGFPLCIVWLMTVRTALQMKGQEIETPALFNRIRYLRVIIQGISVLAIVATSFWGMYVNASIGVLGR